MKKTILALFITSTLFSTAQTNLDFESWTGIEPDGWISLNFITQLGSDTSTIQETSDPAEGSSSAKLVTVDCAACPGFGLPSTISGVVISGIVVGTTPHQGFAYTGKPTSIDLQYKCAPMTGDAGLVLVQLTRWDAGNAQQVIIAQGIFTDSTQVSSWKSANIPLQYANNDTPDTLLIMGASSASSAAAGIPGGGTAAVGSEFYLDSIVINDPAVGVVSFAEAQRISVYPNPAQGNINFRIESSLAESIEIFDMAGKNVETTRVNSRITTVETSKFPNGFYLYKIKDRNGNLIQQGKYAINN